MAFTFISFNLTLDLFFREFRLILFSVTILADLLSSFILSHFLFRPIDVLAQPFSSSCSCSSWFFLCVHFSFCTHQSISRFCPSSFLLVRFAFLVVFRHFVPCFQPFFRVTTTSIYNQKEKSWPLHSNCNCRKSQLIELKIKVDLSRAIDYFFHFLFGDLPKRFLLFDRVTCFLARHTLLLLLRLETPFQSFAVSFSIFIVFVLFLFLPFLTISDHNNKSHDEIARFRSSSRSSSSSCKHVALSLLLFAQFRRFLSCSSFLVCRCLSRSINRLEEKDVHSTRIFCLPATWSVYWNRRSFF